MNRTVDDLNKQYEKQEKKQEKKGKKTPKSVQKKAGSRRKTPKRLQKSKTPKKIKNKPKTSGYHERNGLTQKPLLKALNVTKVSYFYLN